MIYRNGANLKLENFIKNGLCRHCQEHATDRNVLADAQKQMIKDDLQMIQARTCIQFQEVSVPYSSPYIYYRPTTLDGICGQSPLGMQSDVNAIDLNFDSSSPVSNVMI